MAAILDFLLSPICLLRTGNPPYKFPITSCDRDSAVQNGGERFIVATTRGEIKCVLGEFKLDEGAGTHQLISGKKVHHNQAFNGKEFAQILTNLYYAVASEANSRKIMQVISMILLMYTHTYI